MGAREREREPNILITTQPSTAKKNIKNSFFLPINESKTANQRTQLDTTYRETDYSSSTKKEEQATLKHTHQRLNQQCGTEETSTKISQHQLVHIVIARHGE